MQITQNFSREELIFSGTAIRKGLDNRPVGKDVEENIVQTAYFLQAIRDKLGRPVRVLSCYRSPVVNKAVGGSRTSAHLLGNAADIQVPGMGVKELCLFIKFHFPEASQCIYEFGEGGWCHVERPGKARGVNQWLTAAKAGGKTVYTVGIA